MRQLTGRTGAVLGTFLVASRALEEEESCPSFSGFSSSSTRESWRSGLESEDWGREKMLGMMRGAAGTS